jgi:hypothetical protein
MRKRRKTAAERRLERDVADARAALDAIRHVGDQMSNLCFNLGQNACDQNLRPIDDAPAQALSGRNQRVMYELYQAWDAVIAAHRAALLPRVRREGGGHVGD